MKPSETLYKGTTAHIFCCLNVDPRGFIPIDGVYFVQNGIIYKITVLYEQNSGTRKVICEDCSMACFISY